jgi:hypothetical protein
MNLGRADVPVGLGARQRVPTRGSGFKARSNGWENSHPGPRWQPIQKL